MSDIDPNDEIIIRVRDFENNYVSRLSYDALRAEVERLRAENRWIPVSERLPEPIYGEASEYMDVAYGYDGLPIHYRETAQYWPKYGWVWKWEGKPVTYADMGFTVYYWKPQAPLPAAPKDGE